MKIARLDYLDLQIYEAQKTTLIVPQIDDDGLAYQSTLIVNDVLAIEIFALLEMTSQSATWGSQTLYQSDSKEVFLSVRPFQKSLQFKGAFFLREDAILKLNQVIQFLKQREIKFLVSRLDISFLVRDSKLYQALDRCDFKRLTQYTLKKKKAVVYYKAYNSRFNLVAYGKTAQVKKEKGANYLKNFLSHYKLTALPDDLINLELRVLGTDSCAEITAQIAEQIDLPLLKSLVIAQATKRMRLTRTILGILLKSSI